MKKITFLLVAAFAANIASAQKLVGGDISLLPKYEEKKAVYKDKDGKSISDVLLFMKEQGMNAMRVRLFVDPSQAPADHKDQGVYQDLAYVKALGKRIKDAGMTFLLDFHYSDTWTDPSKHSTPASWTATSAEELAQTLYDYTVSALNELKEYGAEPDYIQVGNEITYGQLWPTGHIQPYSPWGGYPKSNGSWDNFYLYIKKGTEACRFACPNAKVVIHVEMSKSGYNVMPFFQKFTTYNPDYDIIGLSYYPYYHGNLTTLNNLLTSLESTYPSKKIQLVEAGYPNAYYPGDASFDYTATYPATPEGQQSFTKALINTLNTHANVDGLYWWYPEANGNYVSSNWYNMGLWNNNSPHKALPALYELKNFRDDVDGIKEMRGRNNVATSQWFTLDGRQLSAEPTKQGIYIANSQKVIVR